MAWKNKQEPSSSALNTSRNLAISNISRCLASQTLKYYKEPGTYLEMFQRTQHWPGNKDDPGEISRIVV